ncbi:HpcH/HpaI aldolase/citrate lyase family protein [Paraburkholderia caballeronis]|uniref:HpcH/HpaI aldolase/citrate lyase family protein n=1 Tax=Paraburkholderia caballeronis TaxID=416943 RepID=UPI0010651EBA|nr:CoA ester lyase [Paraburkholderia caballeronis]
MTNPDELRSCLFVPGTHPDRFDKAARSGADAVIVDLEDAVAPDAKPAARDALRTYVEAGARTMVRINAIGSPWFDGDVELCRIAGVTGVVLPKTADPLDVEYLSARVGRSVPLYPLIESAAGIANVERIAASPGVARLMFGTVDFTADLDLQGDGNELLYYRSRLVLASRVAGIGAPLDGPSLQIRDSDALQRASAHARRVGFGGKLCIHPAQVAIVNDVFSASDDERQWAERVVAAACDGAGVFSIDGQMVDAPVIARAQRILARRQRAAA